MRKFGYDNKLKLEKPEQQPKTNQIHKKKRNVIWYNSPFSNSVKLFSKQLSKTSNFERKK